MYARCPSDAELNCSWRVTNRSPCHYEPLLSSLLNGCKITSSPKEWYVFFSTASLLVYFCCSNERLAYLARGTDHTCLHIGNKEAKGLGCFALFSQMGFVLFMHCVSLTMRATAHWITYVCRSRTCYKNCGGIYGICNCFSHISWTIHKSVICLCVPLTLNVVELIHRWRWQPSGI